jgi:UDP-N-acetylglucosamine 1-carboxyvinyltransferase
MPGGCRIGDAPWTLHIKGLTALGAKVVIEEGNCHATASTAQGRASSRRPSPSRGPENLMNGPRASRRANVLENAAREPEVVDLARCLTADGSAHRGGRAPTSSRSRGVPRLGGVTHSVMPDRIEAGTILSRPRPRAAR